MVFYNTKLKICAIDRADNSFFNIPYKKKCLKLYPALVPPVSQLAVSIVMCGRPYVTPFEVPGSNVHIEVNGLKDYQFCKRIQITVFFLYCFYFLHYSECTDICV